MKNTSRDTPSDLTTVHLGGFKGVDAGRGASVSSFSHVPRVEIEVL